MALLTDLSTYPKISTLRITVHFGIYISSYWVFQELKSFSYLSGSRYYIVVWDWLEMNLTKLSSVVCYIDLLCGTLLFLCFLAPHEITKSNKNILSLWLKLKRLTFISKTCISIVVRGLYSNGTSIVKIQLQYSVNKKLLKRERPILWLEHLFKFESASAVA